MSVVQKIVESTFVLYKTHYYRRVVCLKEDRCRLRSGHTAHTVAIINNLVLALIDRLDFNSIPDAQRIFCAHPIQPLNLQS